MGEELSSLNNEEVSKLNQSLDEFIKGDMSSIKVYVPPVEVPKAFKVLTIFLDSVHKNSFASIHYVNDRNGVAHFVHILDDGSIIDVYHKLPNIYGINLPTDEQYDYWRNMILLYAESKFTPEQAQQMKELPTPSAVVKDANGEVLHLYWNPFS